MTATQENVPEPGSAAEKIDRLLQDERITDDARRAIRAAARQHETSDEVLCPRLLIQLFPPEENRDESAANWNWDNFPEPVRTAFQRQRRLNENLPPGMGVLVEVQPVLSELERLMAMPVVTRVQLAAEYTFNASDSARSTPPEPSAEPEEERHERRD